MGAGIYIQWEILSQEKLETKKASIMLADLR